MSFTCKYCGEEFERQIELMNHVRINHKSEKKREKEAEATRRETAREEKEREIERINIEPPIYKPMDPRDIMLEVIQSPVLKLNKNQIDELLDIADDYEGVLSPVMLKRLLSNFDGVTEKKAEYIADRYSIKLEKAKDRLSIADAKRLGLDLIPKSEHDGREGDIDNLEARIAKGISEGLRSIEHRFNVNNDIFAKPIEKILSNAADATGITSKIINIFFTAIEEQVRKDPYIIGDARDFIPQLPKLISSNQNKEVRGEGEERERGREREREERFEDRFGDRFEERRDNSWGEEGYRYKNKRRKTEDIFGELDKFFDEDMDDEEGEESEEV